MDERFETSAEHLLAELERVDLLIRARVATLRRTEQQDEHFHGLYISEEEVDGLLDSPRGRPRWLEPDSAGRWAAIDAALARLAADIERRSAASRAAGVELRLDRLRALFALEPLERDALLVCLACELDQRYEKLYAYLQDDVTRKRPTVDLVFQLLLSSPAQQLAARRHFLPDAPLFRHGLVEFVDDAAQPHPTLLSRGLKSDERIVQYLLGSDAVDARLRLTVDRHPGGVGLDELVLDDGTRRDLGALQQMLAQTPPPVIHLTGPAGVGKLTQAAALCRARGQPLLVLRLERLLAQPAGSLPATLALVEREARLQGAALAFQGVDVVRGEAQHAVRAALRDALQAGTVPVFLTGEEPWDEPLQAARETLAVPVDRPDAGARLSLWQRALADARRDPGLDPAVVAARFRLTAGQIVAAAATARAVARRRGAADGQLATQDLFEACRQASNRRLGTLARKVQPRYRWQDIVLPPDRVSQLRELCNHVRYRERVYGDWGFGRKLALGKGLTVLFAGPSGTGKTMAADVIAGELGLDLYKIDLSSVISKFIGETEKNLSRIFDEAETSNAILFFDEADALFGKRSDVKDSHDRYANIEVGYLLQRMEEYEGIAILATNLRKNMDEAFVRRLHFTLDLPFPDETDRHRIWQGIWPADTPRDASLDLQLLARRFEMTGGNIRNVALAAAFLAAEEGEAVNMGHLVHATQREYQKSGKLLRDAGLGDPQRG